MATKWRAEQEISVSRAKFVSIAKTRERTRSVRNEFVPAFYMCFASRQKAVFGDPEIGFGLPPGGGALEWLLRIVGRSRMLEITLPGDDLTADGTERYDLVNSTLDDGELDNFVGNMVRCVATFDHADAPWQRSPASAENRRGLRDPAGLAAIVQ